LNLSLEKIIFEQIEFFRSHLTDVATVLDIGTGTSIPVHVFSEKFPGTSFHTTDIVDIRQRKDLPFVIYDGKNLPFSNSEFDVSVLNETLHHCEDPESVLKEAARVAGSVYLIEHFPREDADINEIIKTETTALKNFGLECNYYRPFTEDSLYQLFEKTALKVIAKEMIPYYGKREIEKYFFKLKY